MQGVCARTLSAATQSAQAQKRFKTRAHFLKASAACMQGVAEHPASAAFSGLAAKEDVLQACLKGATRIPRAGSGVAPTPAGACPQHWPRAHGGALICVSDARAASAGALTRRLPCRRGGCARWRPATRLLVRALMPAPQEVLAWANALTPAGTRAAPGELPPPIACHACSAGMWIEFDPAWRADAPPASAQVRTRPAGLGAAERLLGGRRGCRACSRPGVSICAQKVMRQCGTHSLGPV